MRRMRTRLFLAAAACFALALPARAQVAPTLSGETGLFEIKNADSLAAGRFSVALSWSMWTLTAAPVPGSSPLPDDPLRYDLQRIGGSVGYGLTDRWELVVGTGSSYYSADSAVWQGLINGRYRFGSFSRTEMDKVRLGSKLVLNPHDPVRVALFGGISIPTQSENDVNALGTYRADYDFGASFTGGWVTFQTSYLLTGKLGVGTPTPTGGQYGYTLPNEWRNAVGVAVPLVPGVFKLIGEINRVHYDGGDTQPVDYSEALVGGRVGFGDFSAGAAVRVNIDRWAKYGSTPGNIGGVVQFAYAPPAPKAERKRVVAAHEEPAPEPATEAVPPAPPPAPAPVVAPAPAPSEPAVVAAPAARPATSTTDEILFDQGKTRLTNIAKAILDGVALRLKNNLAATCTISAYTDGKEKGDHAALAKGRADAAKDYLMKRHGIDGSRIATEVKGDGDSPDATRNRRAVVSVTFP
ncbi:MAG TPA: OmpA family protein [Thermoanaerobaculia bacterium]|nr:OmpA family protein [Thermoanaerobaculia bacterium]